MYYPRIKTPVIALAVVCAAAALSLIAPATVTAESPLPREETSEGMSVVCPELQRPALAWQPSEANLAGTDPHGLEIHVALRTQPVETVRIELQVPEALLRALLTEERAGGSVDLHEPEGLLGSLGAEGRVQRPQRLSLILPKP